MPRDVRLVCVRNVTRGTIVVPRAVVADTPLRRLLGLMGRRDWGEADGLLIRPCSAIHTFFMRMPIDVVFATREGVVLDVAPARRPWRVGPIVRRAAWALELPVGGIAASSTRLDDVLIAEATGDRPAD